MKRSMLFVLSLGICALLPAALFAAGKPNPNSCGTDVSNVSITIDSSSGYKITPDMNLPYANTTGKRNKISLGFQNSNCSYDLTMNLFSSTRSIKVSIPADPPHNAIETTAWFFNFDRIGSVPVTPVAASADIATFQSWCLGGVQREADGSIALNLDGLRQDVYAPCGIDNNGNHFARRNVGFSLVDDYGLRFQNSPIDHHSELANGTAFIKVYHYAADATNPERWILEPDIQGYLFTSYDTDVLAGDFDGTGQLSALLYSPNSGEQSKVGNLLVMPFRMVVTTTYSMMPPQQLESLK